MDLNDVHYVIPPRATRGLMRLKRDGKRWMWYKDSPAAMRRYQLAENWAIQWDEGKDMLEILRMEGIGNNAISHRLMEAIVFAQQQYARLELEADMKTTARAMALHLQVGGRF